jgi:hypothetical protein
MGVRAQRHAERLARANAIDAAHVAALVEDGWRAAVKELDAAVRALSEATEAQEQAGLVRLRARDRVDTAIDRILAFAKAPPAGLA